MKILGIGLALVLMALSLFHVRWALLGPVAHSAFIPQVDGRPAFTPSRSSTWAVALLLSCAALVALCASGIVQLPLSAASVRRVALLASLVFALRAIGELRLVGFFKRVRNTEFARWDSLCFSPLCVLMSAAFLALALR